MAPKWAKVEPPMPPWGQPSYPHPMEGEYSTGDDAVASGSALAPDNDAIASHVSPSEPRKTAFHRGAMGGAEAAGARLSISPSMKIPQNEPSSGMTQANTRIVQARGAGRTTGSFQQGMSEL
jgi:hypothetical protein